MLARTQHIVEDRKKERDVLVRFNLYVDRLDADGRLSDEERKFMQRFFSKHMHFVDRSIQSHQSLIDAERDSHTNAGQ